MPRFKHIFEMVFLLVLYAASNPASAQASAIAFGSDSSWGWATETSQAKANNASLMNCNKANPKKDCKLQFTKAIARAVGEGKMSWGKSDLGMDDAKKRALEACGDASCKINLETIQPGFYSLAKSEPDKDGAVAYHLTYASTDWGVVRKEATQTCEKESSRKCTVVWSGAIPGIHKVNSTPSSRPVASETSCRPNTPNIRCSSQCTNGNCTVTYENGCRMNVQVQPRFDGASNQWTYPAPSC